MEKDKEEIHPQEQWYNIVQASLRAAQESAPQGKISIKATTQSWKNCKKDQKQN